jgi:hypothetical protein
MLNYVECRVEAVWQGLAAAKFQVNRVVPIHSSFDSTHMSRCLV